MRLIVDTNILISSIITRSQVRRIIASSGFEFYIPDFLLTEINKHRKLILKKSGLSNEEMDEILENLLSFITIVPYGEYKKYYAKAKKIMADIDIKDSPFLALAMSFRNDGIWTNDKDFHKQDTIKIWSTRDLLEIIE